MIAVIVIVVSFFLALDHASVLISVIVLSVSVSSLWMLFLSFSFYLSFFTVMNYRSPLFVFVIFVIGFVIVVFDIVIVVVVFIVSLKSLSLMSLSLSSVSFLLSFSSESLSLSTESFSISSSLSLSWWLLFSVSLSLSS